MTPLPELLRFVPASGCGEEDVVGAGTLYSLEPQSLHFGAGQVLQHIGVEERELRSLMAAQYEGITDFDDVKTLIMESPYPPRIVAFTTADLARVRGRALATIDDSNATQNRLDAVLSRLGLYRALVRFFLLARARGHSRLPSFSENEREAAGRALLALTPTDDAVAALEAPSISAMLYALPPGAAAVAAAFPAVFTGRPADSLTR